jgi:hypothetical protein
MTVRRPLVLDTTNLEPSVLLSGDLVDPTALGTGTTSSATILYGDNVWRTAPTGSSSGVANTNVCLFGTSYYTRQFGCTNINGTGASGISGTIGGNLTVNTSNTHYLAPGMSVSLASPAGSTAFDLQYFTAVVATVTSTTQFTATPSTNTPITTSGSNTAAWECMVLQRPAPASSYRTANSYLNGVMNLLSCYAKSGVTVAGISPQLSTMLAFNPGIIIGDFGIWNDVENGTIGTPTSGGALNTLITMVTTSLATGAFVVFEGFAAATFATGIMAALAEQVMQQMNKLAASYPKLIVFDKWKLTVNPTTGIADADLFQADGEHPSQKSAQVYGYWLAQLLALHGAVPTVQSPLANSVNDRYTASTSSNNFYNGGWSATGQAGSTQDPHATGTFDNEAVFGISQTAAGSTAVASLAARGDGYGYDQVVTITRTTPATDGYHQVLLGFVGSGSGILADVAAGKTYQFSLDFSLLGDTGSLANLLRFTVYLDVNYTLSGYTGELRSSAMTDIQDYPLGTITASFQENLICPPVTIPAGATINSISPIVLVYSQDVGIYTIKAGRIAVRNVA